MIFEQHKLFWRRARIILDDKALSEALKVGRHVYISGLSYDNGLGSSRVHIKTKQTTVIKLGGDYFAKFNDTTRNEIRRMEKTPELSFHIPDENRAGIYELYRDFEVRGARYVRPQEYFSESLLCGAYLNDELIAAILCYDSYPYLRAHAIVSSKAHLKWKSFALRRLVFEICRYGELHKYRWVDLGAINTSDPAKAGITAFKQSFGGDVVNDYHYTYKSPIARFLGKVFLRTVA